MSIKQLNNEKETGITIHYVNEDYDEEEELFSKNNFDRK
jgi:folate-dependent phosphoribosylglycinamide formyltransferase PurN